jgi:ATP-binding cassette, subfamily B, multidrug efflux pump
MMGKGNERRRPDSKPAFGPGSGKGPGPRRGGPMAHMGGAPVVKAKDLKGAFKKLLEYIGKHKKLVWISLIFAVLSTIGSIAGPKILGEATTVLFEGIFEQIRGTGEIDFDYIGRILLIVLGLYLASAIFLYILGLIMAKVATDVSYRLRKDVSEKINRLPLKYFDKTSHGDVLSRVTNDIDTINQSLSSSLTQVITSICTLIGVFVMMLTISWKMTLVSLIILPISMVMMGTIMKKSQKYFKTQQKTLGDLNGHVEEMFSGHIIMKAFNGEEKSIEKFNKTNNKLYNSAWKAQFLTGLMMPLMFFIGNLGYVAVAIYGGYLAFAAEITVGDIQAFTQYVRSFTRPLSQIAQIGNTLQGTAAAAERVFEFLDEEELVAESENPIKVEHIEGHVEFKNVKFGYYSFETIVKDFSAIAKPGQKVAIVGPTGAGKTTMVKLLMRFYDVNEGQILIDSKDITDFTRKDLRDNFGMVLQDSWLYNGTIMENIRYGRPDATDEEVVAAAKAAHVDHFVRTLPDGYDMVLNEEASNVSLGQKQLLTIARAVLADPRILILDEATSSVDTRTEILIQKAMDNLMSNRTSFVIAHRLSTIKNADLILVMRDGDIVEQGSHDELLKQKGFYFELHNSQFEVKETNLVTR